MPSNGYPSSRGWSTRTGIIGLGVGIILLVNALIAYGLWQDRHIHFSAAAKRLEGVARTYETYTGNALSSLDAVLRVLQDRVREGAAGDELRALLKAHKARSSHLLDLMVLDAQARIVAWSAEGPEKDFSDRLYFTHHRDAHHHDGGDGGLYVDIPRQSRLHDGRWFFGMSRRIDDAQGRFAGVVVAAVGLDYFADVYGKLLEDGAVEVALAQTDGSVMVRVPPLRDPGGVKVPLLADAAADTRILRAGVATDPANGVPWYVVESRVAGFPLVVQVAEPFGAMLVEWWEQVPGTVAVGATTTLIVVGLMLLLLQNATARERAVGRLTQSEAQIRAIFNQSFQFIGLLDTQGRLLRANDTALAFAGVTESAVVGRSFWDTPWWAFDAGGRERVRRAVGEAAAGNSDRFETTHRSRDGRTVQVDVLVKPVLADGTVTMLLVEGHDITELRQAQTLQRTILDNNLVGIAYLRDRKFVWCNRRLEDIFGYTVEELEGRPTEILYASREDYEAFGMACYPSLTGGRVFLREQRMRRKDDTLFWCRLSGKLLVSDDPGQGSIWMIDDIDARRRAEEELREAKNRAETALEELRRTQEILVRSEKMAALGSLVAGVAHEINTPVGITLTGASHLAKEVGHLRKLYRDEELGAADLEEFLETAEEATRLMLANCDRAAALIQSFKQVAVDQTGGERRVFLLRDYLDEILLSLRPRLKKTPHRVAVDCPADLELDGDPGALSQVLTNLIINALDHAFEDGRPGTMTIAILRPEPDTVELRFIDDGKGIPEEIRGKVFDPFFTTRRGAGGSGLGLHILHNLVTRALRGSVVLDSEVGRGTAVTLRFPRVLPKPAPAVPEPAAGS